jgi:hypothetical protein
MDGAANGHRAAQICRQRARTYVERHSRHAERHADKDDWTPLWERPLFGGRHGGLMNVVWGIRWDRGDDRRRALLAPALLAAPAAAGLLVGRPTS